MKPMSWDYVAGFLDGEGCVRIGRGMQGNGAWTYALAVGLVNTDLTLLEEIQSFLGGRGNILKSKKLENRKQCYYYEFYGESARWLLRHIAPYLRAKSRQAELCLALPNRKESPGKATAAQQELLYVECLLLNRVGTETSNYVGGKQ